MPSFAALEDHLDHTSLYHHRRRALDSKDGSPSAHAAAAQRPPLWSGPRTHALGSDPIGTGPKHVTSAVARASLRRRSSSRPASAPPRFSFAWCKHKSPLHTDRQAARPAAPPTECPVGQQRHRGARPALLFPARPLTPQPETPEKPSASARLKYTNKLNLFVYSYPADCMPEGRVVSCAAPHRPLSCGAVRRRPARQRALPVADLGAGGANSAGLTCVALPAQAPDPQRARAAARRRGGARGRPWRAAGPAQQQHTRLATILTSTCADLTT